jgi:hypothetical protein
MEVTGQLHAPTALPPEKEPPPRCPLGKKLDGPQKRPGRRGEEKNLAPTQLRPLGRPARSQSLYRLRYPGSSVSILLVIEILVTLQSLLRKNGKLLVVYL